MEDIYSPYYWIIHSNPLPGNILLSSTMIGAIDFLTTLMLGLLMWPALANGVWAAIRRTGFECSGVIGITSWDSTVHHERNMPWVVSGPTRMKTNGTELNLTFWKLIQPNQSLVSPAEIYRSMVTHSLMCEKRIVCFY